MVMHARKQPRLSDGFHDRGGSHNYEDKYGRKDRDESKSDRRSPRYSNKSSYKERPHVERDKTKVSESNYHSSSHKDRSRTNTRPAASNTTSKDKRSDHKLEIQKSALRMCGDWSEHWSSSSGKLYYYNCTTEASKWEKPKEWSDEKATKTEYGRRKEVDLQRQGKLSANHSNTEKRHSSSNQQSSTQSSSGANSHSNSRYNQSDRGAANNADHRHHHHRAFNASASGRPSDSYRASNDKYGTGFSRRSRDREMTSSSASRMHEQSVTSSRDRDRTAVSHRDHHAQGKDRSSAANRTSGASSSHRRSGSRERYKDSRSGRAASRGRRDVTPPSRYDRSHRHDAESPTKNDRASASAAIAVTVSNHVSRDTADQQPEDMDISPGSTPTEESAVRTFAQMASAGHATTSSAAANSVISQMAQVAASANDSSPSILAALPQLIAQMSGGEGGSTANGSRPNPQLNSAIATLQKLQEALQLQRQKQQQKLLSHIQQLVAQNQQLGLPASQHPPNARSANGIDAAPSSSCASHVATSLPAVGLMSPAALLAAASSSSVITQQLMSLTSSAALAQASVANSGHHSKNSSETTALTCTAATPGATTALRINTSLASDLANATANTDLSAGGTASQSPGAESAGTPLGSPDLHLPDEAQNNGEPTTPIKAPPDRESPVNSCSSSQQGVATALAGGVTTLPGHDVPYKLPPSLGNYFKQELIPHVLGWPTETIERQADHYKGDSHTWGNVYSTQVSCELKKARSLARVSEIQSTLQEQRVLFLRQQVRELETLRNSSASFMSPPAAR